MKWIGESNGTPLQYSCLENPMDGGAWKAAVHGVPEGRTQLIDFTFTFHLHALEKEMATHSSVLAWRIPGTGEPGGLPSVGSHRVGHNWSDLAVAAAHEMNRGEKKRKKKKAGVSLGFVILDQKERKKVKSLSHVRFFATPWAVAYQAPLSMGFSRQ